MRFVLANSSIFDLPGSNGRFVHLASIHYGAREFMGFVDRTSSKAYIEEVTGGHLEVVTDDNLWTEIADYLNERQLMDPRRLLSTK